jgi:hypothetical protein
MKNEVMLQRMRALLGQQFRFRGGVWTLVEVLRDEACLVLRGAPADQQIQPDQFGRPLRRVGPLASIPVLAQDGNALSPELLDLLAARISP